MGKKIYIFLFLIEVLVAAHDATAAAALQTGACANSSALTHTRTRGAARNTFTAAPSRVERTRVTRYFAAR